MLLNKTCISVILGLLFIGFFHELQAQSYMHHRIINLGQDPATAMSYCYSTPSGSELNYNLYLNSPIAVGTIIKTSSSKGEPYYYVSYSSSSPNASYINFPGTIIDYNVCGAPSGGGGTLDPIDKTPLPAMSENYIVIRSFQNPGSSISGAIETTVHFDGLGRPSQNIAMKGGGSQQHLVTPVLYDKYGRNLRDYLPIPKSDSNAGNFRTGDIPGDAQAYYNGKFPDDFGSVLNPYSEKSVENSPLGRVLIQAAPGSDWSLENNHTINLEYQANVSGSYTGKVRQFKVNLSSTFSPALSSPGYYSAGELFKNVTKDENWDSSNGNNHTTEEFINMQGQVVLKRTYNSGIAHDTYYVYDDYGNLTYVLPPLTSSTFALPTTSELSGLCYQYKYDKYNRLIEKQIPGKGWEYIVYNNIDQPILTQDANLREQGKWLFTKYDAFGRVVITGLFTTSTSLQSIMQTTVDSFYGGTANSWETKTTSSSNDYYTNQAYPTSGIETLTLNYYDNYTFNTTSQGLLLTAGTVVFGNAVSHDVKGFATGSRVKVLDQISPKWITSVMHYDSKGRILYSGNYNEFLQTTDKVKHEIAFSGLVKKTENYHKKGTAAAIVNTDNFTYDHMNRLLIHTQTIGTKTELITANTYDETGALIAKKVGNTIAAPLQNVNYAYNIRGWLKQINNPGSLGTDLFGFKLNYNTPTTGTALYNGNISQTQWKTANTDSNLKTYTYSYDALNRLTMAVDNTGKFNLGNSSNPVKYDKNGNITHLYRMGHVVDSPILANNYGFGLMDNLTYTYDSGNKLLKVADAAAVDKYGFKDDAVNTATDSYNDYTYDANGNMKTDANKGITAIAYNHLNLPTSVTLPGGTISYIYDATGVKLEKKIVESGQTNKYTFYAGNSIYGRSGDSGTGSLKFFNHAEGYVEPDGNGGFDYVYEYKDHLGNVRLTYADLNNNGTIEASSEILQERNYYPFGLEHKGYNSTIIGTENNYKTYQGKELQKEFDLNWHDFGARNYDAALGRWMNPDPLADLRYELTPYNYVQNSPMFKIDPDGLTDYTLNKKTGEVTQVRETNDEPDRILKTYTRKSKRGEVKYKKNGEAKVAIGGIEKGILEDGQNFRTNDIVIETGGEVQATVDGVKSFTLQLSEYIGKEIKGFSYSSDGASGEVTDMVLGKYINNDRTTSYGSVTELNRKYGANFSFNNLLQQFHTHPDGKLGATQSAPGQSQDVTGLQRDRPLISNATFIILYRINSQKKPAEYDYTHEYRSQKK